MNISFNGVEGESIVLAMDLKGIACSSGSACTSGTTEPSHVLKAMGVESIMAQGAIRFSIGRSTSRDDLDYVLGVLPDVVGKLREMSPVYSKR
jgi:cysteine desulfurase